MSANRECFKVVFREDGKFVSVIARLSDRAKVVYEIGKRAKGRRFPDPRRPGPLKPWTVSSKLYVFGTLRSAAFWTEQVILGHGHHWSSSKDDVAILRCKAGRLGAASAVLEPRWFIQQEAPEAAHNLGVFWTEIKKMRSGPAYGPYPDGSAFFPNGADDALEASSIIPLAEVPFEEWQAEMRKPRSEES